MTEPDRATVFGLPLDLLSMDETVSRCVFLVERHRPAQHVVLNAAKVVMAQDMPELQRAIAGCDIVNADGQSVVLAARMLGAGVPERVAGIDLMFRLLDEAEARAWPVYFLGARAEVLDRAVAVFRAQHPALVVAGAHHGYFTDDERMARAVRASGARLLLMATPSPKKELYLSEWLPAVGPLLAVGVGGSFDVVAGLARRAPLWMQRSGLEWFYRLLQEPRRLWKRYLVGNSRFVVLTLREWLRQRLV